jgi:hypothetical protein
MNNIKALILGIALALIAPAASRAQIAPATETALTTSTNYVASSSTGSTTIITSQAFSPDSLTGFAVVPNVTLSGGTANVTFNFEPSLDGSNYATITAPLSYVMPVSGTSANTGFYNFAPSISGSSSNNIPYWRLSSVVVGGTGSLTINALTVSKTNR